MSLMAVIGLNIGVSSEVMSNLGAIGINCALISLSAIAGSVLLVWISEHSVMPLEKIRLQLYAENMKGLYKDLSCQAAQETLSQRQPETAQPDDGISKQQAAPHKQQAAPHKQQAAPNTQQAILPNQQAVAGNGGSGFSPLIIIMPAFIAAGVLTGYFFLSDIPAAVLDTILTVSLFFLYTGVGVSVGSNKSVFTYIKKLGWRIMFMPLSIFAGCLLGGLVSGLLLGLPVSWSVISAGGMGYYSLTGAFMTEIYGIEAGAYGFIVNVSRDVFTVILLPLLSKISKGSPIASGAAGCMDSMLMPVSKAVGPELGMVALISGTILSLYVPIWLSIAQAIF